MTVGGNNVHVAQKQPKSESDDDEVEFGEAVPVDLVATIKDPVPI